MKIISVDIGGTNILSALLDEESKIISREKTPTKLSSTQDELVEDVVKSVNTILEESNLNIDEIKAVCVGVPGTVDPKTGVIGNAPNLGITDFNIMEAVSKHFDVPVLVENDVNLAALGIKRFEFDDKVKNMFVVFVGTGIGGALVLDGKLYRGSSNYAGEIGHTLVDKKGKFRSRTKSGSTFEETASRSAVAENIVSKIEKGKKSELTKHVKKKKRIKSGALSDAIEKNDKVAIKELKKAGKTIGTVLGSITTLMNFDTIVLGGGVIEAMADYLLPRIEKSFKKAVLPEPGKIVKIYPTKLGDDAPILGGIVLAEEFIDKVNK